LTELGSWVSRSLPETHISKTARCGAPRGQGPSTSQNRWLRERFCFARDDRVILGFGVSALAQNAKEWGTHW
jgi:hypothetical protein